MRHAIGKSGFAVVIFFLFFALTNAHAGTIWVGTGTVACSTSTTPVRPNIDAALLLAAITPGDSIIRLTATVDYFNSGTPIVLTDWHPGAAGALTISGGYTDCGVPRIGRTKMGGNTGNLFTIQTASQPSSVVKFISIEMTGASARAIKATAGADVTLDNIWIHDNLGGIEILAGATVNVWSTNTIEDHLNNKFNPFEFNLAKGGGIYCSGSNASLTLAGKLVRNSADQGGGLYVDSGCNVNIVGGAVIEGDWTGQANDMPSANEGGAIYIGAGGVVGMSGDANRVIIYRHSAANGAGIYVADTGTVAMDNTFIGDSSAVFDGGAIYARDSGNSVQVRMNRRKNCPFEVNCSEIRGMHPAKGTAIYASNSVVQIDRTVMHKNGGQNITTQYLIYATDGAIINLNAVGLLQNRATALVFATNGATINAKHLTAGGNSAVQTQPKIDFAVIEGDLFKGDGHLSLKNSIIVDNMGHTSVDNSISGSCNYIQNPAWPNGLGMLNAGFPVFKNSGSGDYRLAADQINLAGFSSNIIDACPSAGGDATDRDVEYAVRPVDDVTESNGIFDTPDIIWDMGFDEVTENYSADPLNLFLQFPGSGDGNVVSIQPDSRIDCSAACNTLYPGSTKVVLIAETASGSVFSGWSSDCDEPDGVVCTIYLTTSNRSLKARFDSTSVPRLDVNFAGNGSGQVVSLTPDTSLYCTVDCSKLYPAGTKVLLKATATSGTNFTGWTGACNEINGFECSVTFGTSDLAVTATFSAGQTVQLTAVVDGAEMGRIVSTTPDGRLDCTSECSADFPTNSAVVLRAIPAPGLSFKGWGKGCDIIDGIECTVVLGTDSTLVAALFQDIPMFKNSFEN